MSSRRDTRYNAKRRAASRKRVREIGKSVFVYLFIGFLILGTVSTVLITGAPATVQTPSPTPTPSVNSNLSSLVTSGDQALAQGDYKGAIRYYDAYIKINQQDADVLFKIGKAEVDPKNTTPDYLAGVEYLQRALNINSSASWAAEATSLKTQYEPQAIAAVTATANAVGATGTVTGTTVTTGTAVTGSAPTSPVTSSTTLSNTVPVTGSTVLTK
jgi:hypothetical protein